MDQQLARLAFVLPGMLALSASAQIVITNGVQTYDSLAETTVILSNRCELRITSSIAPLTSSVVHLNSPDAYLLFSGVKPSTVIPTYLPQVRINGAAAAADVNCRVVQYAIGTIVVPHPSTLQPLQVFSGPHFTGSSAFLSKYTYHKGTGLGAMNAAISSFKLKRGYMATFAQNESGTGISKCYVAQDGDLEVSILPADFDDNIRFVYVLPWRWTAKKGIAGNIESGLNVQWKYNWNIDQNSTRDIEYVPIRQTRWWPGLGQNWQTRGASHLLGYNEPDKSDQANLSIGDALASWPDLLSTGLRLGSPAVSDGGRSGWLYPFLSQADAANRRVDFVAVHYYWCFNPANPTGAADQMYSFLKATYDQVKRPLWVTEWNNGANWTTCGDPTYTQQQAAITAIISMLDSTPFVERYALYNWVEDVRRVKWDDGSLTSAGVAYRDKVSPLSYVQALQDNGTRSFAQLEFETDCLDSSGYGNNGIPAGSPAYLDGRRGKALLFDGENTVVTLPPNVAKANAFTFAAWVNWAGGANWQRIFDFGNSTTHYMFLSPNASGSNLRFAMRNGGSEQIVQTGAMISGTWQHIAVTLSGNTARLYVNGIQVAQNTGMSITPASFSPRVNFLGKSHFVADPNFKGAMDDVLITDYALSGAQVAALQTNIPPQFTSSIFGLAGAVEGHVYGATVTGAATDPDEGDTLTYSKAAGPSWLQVAANGALSGTPTSGDSGTNYLTLRATDSAGQNAFAVVTINVSAPTAAGVWISDASAPWSETHRWSGGLVASGAGQTANFATINITANRTVTLDSSRKIGTLRFSDITSPFLVWFLTNSPGATLTLDTGSTASPSIAVTNFALISASLAGTNGFTKSGPGTLILRGDNSLSGTVDIDTGSTNHDGIVRVAASGALANASVLRIRNNNSGSSTLQLDGSLGSITINAQISATYRNSGVITLHNMAGTNIINGDILLYQGGNSFTVQSDASSANRGLVVFTGSLMYVGALAGTRTNFFTGAGDHLVVGSILDATNGSPISLVKSGAGTLILEGENTYRNGTFINGGTIVVNGSLPEGMLSISGGSTLHGKGVINTSISLPSASLLSPGPGDGVGTLTVNGSVALLAGSSTRIKLNKAAGGHDILRATGSVAYGGTLTVTNLAGMLWAGDSFKIFEAANCSGAFAATNLPALPNGFEWRWQPEIGTLDLISTVPLDPVPLVLAVNSGALHLSWPRDHTGWRVETNAIDVAEPTCWFTLPGSSATNELFVPVHASSTNVFFRLAFP